MLQGQARALQMQIQIVSDLDYLSSFFLCETVRLFVYLSVCH